MIKVGKCRIGPDCPTFIMAEVGQAHDGSLGLAHAYIDAIAEAGADAVKFQTHIADEESTIDDAFRISFSSQDKSRLDYWRRMEFKLAEWQGLRKHARDRNLAFISSGFSEAAIDLLLGISADGIKVASGEISNKPLLGKILEGGLPVFLSTGMSSWKEIRQSVRCVQERKNSLVIMQCTSEYPTSLDRIGINVADQFRKEFGEVNGLSDHSGTIFPGLLAIGRKIDVLEVHVTLSRQMFGPDISSSITLEELAVLCSFRDATYKIDSTPVDKDDLSRELNETKRLFGRSLCVKVGLNKGHVMTSADLVGKKPGNGISVDMTDRVIGRRLARSVTPSRLLVWGDFE
jgi:N,N'-diacetyllegionaminate synthase